jgi:rhamnosyltransferase
MNCGLVVVCHHPPPGLPARLSSLSGQVGPIVVVDNGPPQDHPALAASLAALPGLQLIANPANLGIAAALNQGLQALQQAGCRWALLLDHDSQPASEMLPRLLAAAGQWQGRAIAFVPRIRYALAEIQCRWPVTRPGSRWRFSRVRASAMDAPAAVDLAIGSGMLIDLQRLPQVGGFRESLFIDLVDTEFCLRARHRGFDVVAVPGAELQHALGHVARRRLLGVRVYPTHHAPLRHYYLARNRVLLWKHYARHFPSWAVYELMSGAKLLVKALCFEAHRWDKLRATLRGTWDGLRGTLPGP